MITVDGLPASIRVGPYDIRISTVDQIDGGDCYGAFHLDTQEIQILKQFNSGVMAADTLLHELIHAAWRTTSLPKRGEEQAVSLLATCLTQIFRDHPQLLTWIQNTLESR
jgi:hypothetical protein